MDNLWGDLNKQLNIKSPKLILQEQIDYLEQMTTNSVEGELIQDKRCKEIVDKQTGKLDYSQFKYVFNLKSRYLKGFKYHLLSIHYGIIMYPLYVQINMDFAQDLYDALVNILPDTDERELKDHGEIFVKNEEEYIKLLSVILGSEQVLQIIANIKLLADEEFSELF